MFDCLGQSCENDRTIYIYILQRETRDGEDERPTREMKRELMNGWRLDTYLYISTHTHTYIYTEREGTTVEEEKVEHAILVYAMNTYKAREVSQEPRARARVEYDTVV